MLDSDAGDQTAQQENLIYTLIRKQENSKNKRLL